MADQEVRDERLDEETVQITIETLNGRTDLTGGCAGGWHEGSLLW